MSAKDQLCKTPPNWKRPDEVMKLHQFRMKNRALKARVMNLNKTVFSSEDHSKNSNDKIISKNPFRRLDASQSTKRRRVEEADDDASIDGALLRLINSTIPTGVNQNTESQNECLNSVINNIIPKPKEDTGSRLRYDELPVDWTLRTRLRIMSTKPFPWNIKLKTSEEASGVTGFTRCQYSDSDNCNSLDTSLNARFHQCCLIWQHPSIPWLQLYPRVGQKSSSQSQHFSLLPVKDSLYKHWIDSFRSLFQLVKVKQCPYFYVISNTFTCLFRAAGICSYPEINALLTPTTRGFRQLLKNEDIEFTMPLRSSQDASNPKTYSVEDEDVGCESIDSPKDEDEDEETEKWLIDMGVEEAEIKRLNSSQVDMKMGREKQVDSLPESLIYVEGVEAQALFNFLINCKSIIPNTGSFAGIPPTLIAPVAFTGSALYPLKVRESKIKNDEVCYHSMEIIGPILPNTIHSVCELMETASMDSFSVTFADLVSSRPFSAAIAREIDSSSAEKSLTPVVFSRENLSDCGFKPSIIAKFCRRSVKQFDSIKFLNSSYSFN